MRLAGADYMTGGCYSPEAGVDRKNPRLPIGAEGGLQAGPTTGLARVRVDCFALGALLARVRIVLAANANVVFAAAGNAFHRHIPLAAAYSA